MKAGTPRSYLIETSYGELLQNGEQLRIRNNQEPIREPVDIPTTTKQSQIIHSWPVTRSQTGTTIHPPDRLLYEPRT